MERSSTEPRNDFDSLLEHSPVPVRDLHAIPLSAYTTPPSTRGRSRGRYHGRGTFWSASPDLERKSRASSRTDQQQQSRRGDAPRRNSNARFRHSHDAVGSTTASIVAARRPRSRSLGPQTRPGRAGSGGGGGRGGVSRGGASVEYEAILRKIEREREVVSRRTQQQLRDLEAAQDDGGRRDQRREGARAGYDDDIDREEDDRSHGVSEVEEETLEENERYSSFGSRGSDNAEGNVTPGSHHWRTNAQGDEYGATVGTPPSPGLFMEDDIDERHDDGHEDSQQYHHGGRGKGEEALRLAESPAQELRESFALLTVAGRPFDVEVAISNGLDSVEGGSVVSEVLAEETGTGDIGSSASAIPDELENGDSDTFAVGESQVIPTGELGTSSGNKIVVEEDSAAGVSDSHEHSFSRALESTHQAASSSFGAIDQDLAADTESDRVSGRDGDEADDDEYGSESFEVDGIPPPLEIDMGGVGNIGTEMLRSTTVSELYSPLVTPPSVADGKDTPPRSFGSEYRRRDAEDGSQYSQDWGMASPLRLQLENAGLSSRLKSPSSATLQRPTEQLDLKEGQKEFNHLTREAAAVHAGGGRENLGEQQTLLKMTESIQPWADAERERQDFHTSSFADYVNEVDNDALPVDGPRADAPAGSRLDDGRALVSPPRDLLLDGDYTSIEPARPPALSDWIALGASETRRALSTIRETPANDGGGLSVSAQHDHGEMNDDGDFEEDSFVSGYDVDGGGGGGSGDSDAELTALVAKIAVRGVESRAALIVQALSRGRKARRMAAAARGQIEAEKASREDARLEAMATMGVDGYDAGQQGNTQQVGGSAVRDMEWLTRKARQECLSDSFASSDDGEDMAMPVRCCILGFWFCAPHAPRQVMCST